MSAEPVAWIDLLKAAQKVVESKPLWRQFVDDTPLSNDIAVWMADFAQEYASSPAQARALAIAEAATLCAEIAALSKSNGSAWTAKGASTCEVAIRALSPAPSVTEEWLNRTVLDNVHLGVDATVRATLTALGVEVKS